MVAKILYTSLIDISLPYGPGVNERVFLQDMLGRFGGNLLAVVPTPSRGVPPELRALRLRTIPTVGSVRRAPGWIGARLFGLPLLLHAQRRFAPDLVVMRAGSLAVPHYVLARLTNTPYVLKTAGDVSFSYFYDRHWSRRALSGLNASLFRGLVNDAACVDVASNAQRERAVAAFPDREDRIHVIDNGVDTSQFRRRDGLEVRERLGFADEDFVFGYVGNYPMQRGGKEVVDIVVALRDLGVRGLIVGDSGEAEGCRKYALARGVAQDVVVHGEAPFSEVPTLMSSMDSGISVLRPKERGAAEQKVRQYLSVGMCVIGVAGSNDFLDGRPFARVIGSHDAEEVIEAAASFVRLGRDRVADLGRQARAFAQAELAFAARNDERLRLWRRFVGPLADGAAAGGSEGATASAPGRP